MTTATANLTDLTLSGNVTLTGGGTVNLVNADRILGSGILTNVNNLIQGDTNTAGGSLGNNLETIIGPGDSGGPALVPDGGGYAIAGVNTFVEGYGGQFGDIGGGVVLAPYVDWINSTMAVPEPSACAVAMLGALFLRSARRKPLH